MLVLSRKKFEAIVISGNITVTVVEIGKGSVKIGITAPEDVSVHRQEIADQIKGQSDEK